MSVAYSDCINIIISFNSQTTQRCKSYQGIKVKLREVNKLALGRMVNKGRLCITIQDIEFKSQEWQPLYS